MANDPNKIRFAPNGAIFIAPAPTGTGGTVLPDAVGDGGVTAPTGFKPFGYVNESGVTITPQINTDPVTAWQSAVPVLYNVKDASFSIKATLMEMSKLTSENFFGATWVVDSVDPALWRLDLSSVPTLKELSVVVDWAHSGKHYRVVIPRAMVSDRGAITLQRSAATEFELTFEAMDFSGSLGYVLTDDANVGS